MQLFKDACRKKCCHFCIPSLSQSQQFYYISSQKGYFTINSCNLNFVKVDGCNIYADFAKNVGLLEFSQGH